MINWCYLKLTDDGAIAAINKDCIQGVVFDFADEDSPELTVYTAGTAGRAGEGDENDGVYEAEGMNIDECKAFLQALGIRA